MSKVTEVREKLGIGGKSKLLGRGLHKMQFDAPFERVKEALLKAFTLDRDNKYSNGNEQVIVKEGFTLSHLEGETFIIV